MNNTNTIENIETTNSSSVDEVLNQINNEEISNEEILEIINAKSTKKAPKATKKPTTKKSKKTKTPVETVQEVISEVVEVATEVVEPITEILETPEVAQIVTEIVAEVLSTEVTETVVEEVANVEIVPVTEEVLPIAIETPKVVKTPRVKVVIDPVSITLPEGVVRDVKKACVTFKSDKHKAVLKGASIEFSAVVENLDPRLYVFSTEEIQTAHLGSMKAVLRKLTSNDDLQTIINTFFA